MQLVLISFHDQSLQHPVSRLIGLCPPPTNLTEGLGNTQIRKNQLYLGKIPKGGGSFNKIATHHEEIERGVLMIPNLQLEPSRNYHY